jgi:hypothetical protein
MRNLHAPGVYIREVEVKPPLRLRLDITGFVGQSERGPLNFPQPITSLGEYQEIFGDFTGYSYLSYSVFAFFANGGEKCYVVRVSHESAKKAALDLLSSSRDQKGKPVPFAHVEAINEGDWGNSFKVAAESVSSGDLILTELTSDLDAQSSMASFKSVRGNGKGDIVKLIHPSLPDRQAQAKIDSIDFKNGTVVFEKAVGVDFPAGSRVLGKGFKLIFRSFRKGQLVRGELFDNLSPDPDHERYFVRVINGDPEEPDYVTRLRAGYSILARVTDLCEKGGKPCARIEDQTDKKLRDGGDGSLKKVEARHFTGYMEAKGFTGSQERTYFRPPELLADGGEPKAVATRQEKLFGLAAYEAVDEIGLVVMPDLIIPDFYSVVSANSIQIPEQGIIFAAIPKSQQRPRNLIRGQTDMLFHCQKMGERFAILDSPPGAEIGKGEGRIDEWSNNYQLLPAAKYGALYYPWVRHKAADFGGRELFIPPGGHVAGVYSRSEQQRGVGKVPANEILQGVVELEFCLNDKDQAILNPKGVNCFRVFPGRGLRVWGARTLSLDPMSRYINVRRVVLATIKNILVNLRWTVFEPNDKQLWKAITAALKLFFTSLFATGALAGATPEEAFFIKCDEETNPPEIVDLGQVVAEIGFAPERPAEFILVTIKRSPGALSVSEIRA